MNRILIIFCLLVLTGNTLHAEDRLFTRVYQSNVLPSGGMELEYWNTVRSGRDNLYNCLVLK